jgi:hypothetical protein
MHLEIWKGESAIQHGKVYMGPNDPPSFIDDLVRRGDAF